MMESDEGTGGDEVTSDGDKSTRDADIVGA
jgi:hypothetical protein